MSKPFLFLMLIFATSSSIADMQKFVFDKSHADITFTVSHLGFSSTHGRFNKFDGSLMLDPDAIEKSTVSVVIRTDSIETSLKKEMTI